MMLVTGTTGFVGRKIMEVCKDAVSSPSLRGATEEDIKRIIDASDADIIVHTAAISDIGECAKDPEGSYYANVVIPQLIAKNAGGRKLIFCSSDQVYSGCAEEGPYTEETVKGGNLYACEKIEMEERVLDIDPAAVMLRLEWMYDYVSYKGNFFLNMLQAGERVSASRREYRGFTYVKEVAENLQKAALMSGGAYNFGSETTQSVYEITKDFLKLIGKDTAVDECAPGHNLWMNCEKARKYGIEFSDTFDGLKKCAADGKIVAL